MISAIFATPIAQTTVETKPEQLAELRAYLLELRAVHAGERRSNQGGWHSPGNLFDDTHRSFPFLRDAITRAVLDFAGQAFGWQGEVAFALTGWAVINRAGDYNVAHNHSKNLLSGAFYVAAPDDLTGGEIVFSDPRFNLNTYSTPQMQEKKWSLPWDLTTVPVRPRVGDLLVFPSWLTHSVNAFTAADPEALRIVVSFNVTL